jgi:hypothetical protein
MQSLEAPLNRLGGMWQTIVRVHDQKPVQQAEAAPLTLTNTGILAAWLAVANQNRHRCRDKMHPPNIA